MKKILFTIQWYPSVRSANVLCDDEIMRALLAEKKYEVHCLVYWVPGRPAYEVINGIHVHRFIPGLLWPIFIWGKLHDTTLLGGLVVRINRFLLRVKQLLSIFIYPVFEPFTTRRFAKQAVRLHKKEKFDVVISEHNGIDTLYAGYIIKKTASDIKFIPILWDPIVGKAPAKYLSRSFCEKRLERFDEKILSLADTIVAMQSNKKNLTDRVVHKSYFERIQFLDLPRLLAPVLANVRSKFIKPGNINIIYSGIISFPDRDPSFIIELLNDTGIENINLMLFCNGNVESLFPLIKKFHGDLTFYPYIKRDELLKIYEGVDIFLNLGGANPNMLPSKIFEYMSYGKPILSTYTIADDSSKKYLDRYPLALMINQQSPDRDSLIVDLRDFILTPKSPKCSFETVCALFPDNNPNKYVQLIANMLFDEQH